MENGGEWIAQKRTNSECPPQSHGMAPHFFMGRFFCERKNEHRLIGQTKFALDDAVKLGFLFGRGEQRADLFLITRLEKSAPEQAGQKQICGFMRGARDFELLKRAARGNQLVIVEISQSVPCESPVIKIQVNGRRLIASSAKPDRQHIITFMHMQQIADEFPQRFTKDANRLL